jgi:hypothetical protein
VGPNLWTPAQLDAIEQRYPSHEVRALVAELRRVNILVGHAWHLVLALADEPLTHQRRHMLVRLRERLQEPATGRRKPAP